jgi:putative acetyltransferase
MNIRLSTESDTAALAAIWRASVRATHDFLLDADFREIDTLVAEHYLPATRVWVALDETGRACGFLGLSGAHVDALFIDPASRGQGAGRRLLAHAESIAGRLRSTSTSRTCRRSVSTATWDSWRWDVRPPMTPVALIRCCTCVRNEPPARHAYKYIWTNWVAFALFLVHHRWVVPASNGPAPDQR